MLGQKTANMSSTRSRMQSGTNGDAMKFGSLPLANTTGGMVSNSSFKL